MRPPTNEEVAAVAELMFQQMEPELAARPKDDTDRAARMPGYLWEANRAIVMHRACVEGLK